MIKTEELIFRLFLATIIGGIIGAERETTRRPAGLRTHTLVTLGSALYMLLSLYGHDKAKALGLNTDPHRIAAQVVSGMGFLGAGTIIRTQGKVYGLTTAANLWVCAAIGLCIGGGYYFISIISAFIVLITLVTVTSDETKSFKVEYKKLIITSEDRNGLMKDIGKSLADNHITIQKVGLLKNQNNLDINILLKLPFNMNSDIIFSSIEKIDGVKTVSIE